MEAAFERGHSFACTRPIPKPFPSSRARKLRLGLHLSVLSCRSWTAKNFVMLEPISSTSVHACPSHRQTTERHTTEPQDHVVRRRRSVHLHDHSLLAIYALSNAASVTGSRPLLSARNRQHGQRQGHNKMVALIQRRSARAPNPRHAQRATHIRRAHTCHPTLLIADPPTRQDAVRPWREVSGKRDSPVEPPTSKVSLRRLHTSRCARISPKPRLASSVAVPQSSESSRLFCRLSACSNTPPRHRDGGQCMDVVKAMHLKWMLSTASLRYSHTVVLLASMVRVTYATTRQRLITAKHMEGTLEWHVHHFTAQTPRDVSSQVG